MPNAGNITSFQVEAGHYQISMKENINGPDLLKQLHQV
jgi:hypothetical protein